MSITINTESTIIANMHMAIIKAKCPDCGIVVKIKPNENGYYFGRCPYCGHEIES